MRSSIEIVYSPSSEIVSAAMSSTSAKVSSRETSTPAFKDALPATSGSTRQTISALVELVAIVSTLADTEEVVKSLTSPYVLCPFFSTKVR